MGYELLVRAPTAEKKLADAVLVEQLRQAVQVGLETLADSAPASAPTPASPAPTQDAAQPSAIPTSATAAAADALATAAADLPAELAGPLSIPNGPAKVAARLYRLEGGVAGADLEVAFGGTELELRRAFQFAQQLADQAGGVVFDPQLSVTVGRGSLEDVVGRWRTSQNWLGDVAGTLEDGRAMLDLAPPPPLISPRNRVILLVGGGLLALYWLVGVLLNAFR